MLGVGILIICTYISYLFHAFFYEIAQNYLKYKLESL